MIMFSNRTVQIEESEESVRLRSLGPTARHIISSSHASGCFDFGFLQKLFQPLFPPSLLRLSCLRRRSSSKRRERPSTSAVTGIHAARRDDARRRKPRRFRQDFGIPDEIELVLRLRERTRSMFVRGFAAPIRRIGGAPG
ncbi:unnamed protein product [Microthlaspi erraticum]|uniref:Uncharacterized protein n=1 Tax=Microthlaspi erraticum TaxID=1685480 RepID=A0A6D2K4L7_9BRAS|nr:unnamed protein product [Microthlaspi erraticum]